MQVITTHFNADFDCLASMVAVQKLYPSARMVFPGSLEKATQNFLSRHGQVFHFSRIKEIDLDSVNLLVVVDTQDPGRIGLFESILGKPGLEIHVYDHHMDVVKKIPASKAVVCKRGSSATVLFEILSAQAISLTPLEATVLTLGIYQDTNSLVSPSTVPEDFLAVSSLLRMGADLGIVAEFVEPRLNQEQVAVMNDLIRNMEVHTINGCELVLATATVEHYVGELSVVAHKIMDLENLGALFLLVGLERRVYLIGRSRVEAINAAEIAHAFDGGGHATAASASIKNMTLVQAREKFLAVAGEKIKPPVFARDIMHSPAISVPDTATITSVEKILTRFNLNTLPVVSGDKPVGLITRQIVEKAIHHKMEKEPLVDFMVREFAVTTPDAYFKNLIPCIIEDKQKLVPVVSADEGSLLGIVSRGDLLRVLYGNMVKYTGIGDAPLFETRDKTAKNVKSLMQERLPKKAMILFGQIDELADALGVSVYVVGGFVRDLLLGIENLDIDIVVEGDGIGFARALGKKLDGRVRSHEKFGTSVIVLENNFKIDVATARMEFYKHPAALPTVEMSSIKSDLFRRDFTFNSLAIKLNGEDAFYLIDYFNGLRDLKDKTIRVLHNLSFIEDPSRAFRAVRFEQRYQFTIGKQTESFMNNAIRKGLVDHLSGLRLFNELVLILKEKKPLGYIARLSDYELLKFIHPNLADTASMKILRRVEDLLASSRMFPLPKEPEIWFVYLIGLFYSLEPSLFNLAVERLNMPKKLRDRLEADCQACKDVLTQLSVKKEFAPSEIFNMFSAMSSEAILFLLAVSDSESVNKKAMLYFSQYGSPSHPNLTGDDLIRMGLRPGPTFKAVLRALRDARLNGKLKSREDEMAFVEREFIC
jgi:tRNA nucleotidyltransferase (CCA-adding enzyme)